MEEGGEEGGEKGGQESMDDAGSFEVKNCAREGSVQSFVFVCDRQMNVVRQPGVTQGQLDLMIKMLRRCGLSEASMEQGFTRSAALHGEGG